MFAAETLLGRDIRSRAGNKGVSEEAQRPASIIHGLISTCSLGWLTMLQYVLNTSSTARRALSG